MGEKKTKQIKKTTHQKSFYIKKGKNNKERVTRDIWTLFEREEEKKRKKEIRERERDGGGGGGGGGVKKKKIKK